MALYLILFLSSGFIPSSFASTCIYHDICLNEIKKFTQVEDFYIYTSIEEAKRACSRAADAFLCVNSAPECRKASDKARLNPIIRGGSKLLTEFCGYKSKRRPCCALRTAYMEHSACYQGISTMLNECNAKYRTSLDMILGINNEVEQKQQRYCSVRWYAKCVKKLTRKYCGKTAAGVMRAYVLKAGQHHRSLVESNELCGNSLYGYDGSSSILCQQKHFDKCFVHLRFLQEYLVEDRLSNEDRLLSLCRSLHDTFKCIQQSFNKCLYGQHGRKFEKLHENEIETETEDECLVKESMLLRYRGSVNCLTDHIVQIQKCQTEFEISQKYMNYSMPFYYYNYYFCGLFGRLENCLNTVSGSFCGLNGKKTMLDTLNMAATTIHSRCLNKLSLKEH